VTIDCCDVTSPYVYSMIYLSVSEPAACRSTGLDFPLPNTYLVDRSMNSMDLVVQYTVYIEIKQSVSEKLYYAASILHMH